MVTSLQDDVIRIRVDTARAVREFLTILEQQSAEGETRAPAKPRATAIYRELAPYRLVEYAYVDQGVGEVGGAYIGLPDGTIYSVTDEIPEDAVGAIVKASAVEDLPPIYVYVLLDDPAPAGAIDTFLEALSHHAGLPFVGVFRDQGAMDARFYPGDEPATFAPDAMISRALTETGRHLNKEQVLDAFVRRSETADGRAFARISYGFARHVLEFSSIADRDDFVAWSRHLWEAMEATRKSWENLGFSEVFRPAEPQPAPEMGQIETILIAPNHYQGGKPWRAFDGQALADARAAVEYWAYVQGAIDSNESGARRVDGWVVR